jgi:hypothetical protein
VGFIGLLEVAAQQNHSQLPTTSCTIMDANSFQKCLLLALSITGGLLKYVCSNFSVSESQILFRKANLRSGHVSEQPPFYTLTPSVEEWISC